MIRFIVFAILFFLGYTFFQMIKGLLGRGGPGPTTPDRYSHKGEQMVEDAYDGTYFPLSQAVTAKKDGDTLYFSSRANRDAYFKEHKD